MYTLPQVYNTTDYIQSVDEDVMDVCIDECTPRGLSCDEDIHELCELHMSHDRWAMPVDHVAAIDLYTKLRDRIQNDL